MQGSGSDEVVGCAWDGMTYIVDQQRNVVKYHVGENICAFCAGELSTMYMYADNDSGPIHWVKLEQADL